MRIARKHKKKWRLLGAASLALLLSGCGILSGNECLFRCGEERAASTPLVEFLYGSHQRIPKRDATSGFASTSSFPTRTRPASSPASSSITGAITRHGAHHAAQASNRTGRGERSTTSAKLASVTVTGPPSAIDKGA